MFQITTAQFQQYTRIGLYHIGAFLATHGYMVGGKWPIISGVVLNILTLLWTMYASRIAARVNSLIGSGAIEIVVVKDDDVSKEVNNDKVVSIAEVKSTGVDTSTSKVNVVPK